MLAFASIPAKLAYGDKAAGPIPANSNLTFELEVIDFRNRAELEMQQRMMNLPVAEVFTVQPLSDRPPRGARVLESLECADCGERTMESRTRRFAGQTLCIPCYMKVEQKI